ncbi:hypothetical protein C8R45DRAFT_403883 [Mycena sanguinolenta]|nr:hypothetical protein C8R45DRAFT_403883 [Mycena sanguinolenta]
MHPFQVRCGVSIFVALTLTLPRAPSLTFPVRFPEHIAHNDFTLLPFVGQRGIPVSAYPHWIFPSRAMHSAGSSFDSIQCGPRWQARAPSETCSLRVHSSHVVSVTEPIYSDDQDVPSSHDEQRGAKGLRMVPFGARRCCVVCERVERRRWEENTYIEMCYLHAHAISLYRRCDTHLSFLHFRC